MSSIVPQFALVIFSVPAALAFCQEGKRDSKAEFIERFCKKFAPRNNYLFHEPSLDDPIRKQVFEIGLIRSNLEALMRGIPDKWKTEILLRLDADIASNKSRYGEQRTLAGLLDVESSAIMRLDRFTGELVRPGPGILLPSHMNEIDLFAEPRHFSNAAIEGKFSEYLGNNGTGADMMEAKEVWNGIEGFYDTWKKIYEIKWRLALERPIPPLDNVAEFAYRIYEFQKQFQNLYPDRQPVTIYDPEVGADVPFSPEEHAYQTALSCCSQMYGSGNFVLWKTPSASEFEEWKRKQLEKMEKLAKSPPNAEDEDDPWQGLPDYEELLQEYTMMPDHPLYALRKEFSEAIVAWSKIFGPEWKGKCARFYTRALLLRSQGNEASSQRTRREENAKRNSHPENTPTSGGRQKQSGGEEDNSLLVAICLASGALCLFIYLRFRS